MVTINRDFTEDVDWSQINTAIDLDRDVLANLMRLCLLTGETEVEAANRILRCDLAPIENGGAFRYLFQRAMNDERRETLEVLIFKRKIIARSDEERSYLDRLIQEVVCKI